MHAVRTSIRLWTRITRQHGDSPVTSWIFLAAAFLIPSLDPSRHPLCRLTGAIAALTKVLSCTI